MTWLRCSLLSCSKLFCILHHELDHDYWFLANLLYFTNLYSVCIAIYKLLCYCAGTGRWRGAVIIGNNFKFVLICYKISSKSSIGGHFYKSNILLKHPDTNLYFNRAYGLWSILDIKLKSVINYKCPLVKLFYGRSDYTVLGVAWKLPANY